MTDSLREDFKAEYVLLQGQYEEYDARVLSIKGLATPLLGAGIAFGANSSSITIIIVSALLTMALWALEATWKAFQYANRVRLEELEAWFRGEGDPNLKPFQIYSTWPRGFAEWKGFRAFVYLAKQQFVMLPYVVILLAAMVAGGAVYFGNHHGTGAARKIEAVQQK